MKFKLEKLLRIKELKENNLKNKRAIMKNSLEEEKGKLLKKETELGQCREEFLLNQSKFLKSWEFYLYSTYIERLSKEREGQKEAVYHTEAELNQLTELLIGAHREKKILENFKQKQWQRYLKELDKRQQKFLDEFSIRQFEPLYVIRYTLYV